MQHGYKTQGLCHKVFATWARIVMRAWPNGSTSVHWRHKTPQIWGRKREGIQTLVTKSRARTTATEKEWMRLKWDLATACRYNSAGLTFEIFSSASGSLAAARSKE
eukprot:161493-Pelagomonas_calceolata.AAC.3